MINFPLKQVIHDISEGLTNKGKRQIRNTYGIRIPRNTWDPIRWLGCSVNKKELYYDCIQIGSISILHHLKQVCSKNRGLKR